VGGQVGGSDKLMEPTRVSMQESLQRLLPHAAFIAMMTAKLRGVEINSIL